VILVGVRGSEVLVICGGGSGSMVLVVRFRVGVRECVLVDAEGGPRRPDRRFLARSGCSGRCCCPLAIDE
jgi:hypothetical protein